jgi:hypothetical protein
MTKEQISAFLEGVRFWPQEDQEELIEIARAIDARRSGAYVMTNDERAAVQEGLLRPIAASSFRTTRWKPSGSATA